MLDARATARRAGALIPLFSIPSSESWGIGEIADIPLFSRWLREAGLSVLQLLPLNEMAEGQTSPYSAMSAMAIDPIYISLRELPEFIAWGGESSLDDDEAQRLTDARAADEVNYRLVRELKTRRLEDGFESFLDREWRRGTARAVAMRAYSERERWWLDDYALFRALHEECGKRPWSEWEPGLRDRDPRALSEARSRLERPILYYSWLQWIAGEQWARAKKECGVAILGDLPFMVSADSADVWGRQHQFRLDASVGVPPDAFSETGQDWGLPVYRWDVIESGGYEWMKARARRAAGLFDGFRIDHVVGFYRTFVREKDGRTLFVPPAEDRQRAQGERLLSVFRDCGAAVIAEDLGLVPDFVRASLASLGVPGLRVLRWEREWELAGQPFKDPAGYPAVSVAMSGTHDTDTLAEWWEQADGEERRRIVELPALAEAAIAPDEIYSPRLRDALLLTMFGSGSELVLVPLQDVFGWSDRINTPAVVAERNWTWKVPWPVDAMRNDREAASRAEFLERLGQRAGRTRNP